jgi:CheY-like chemotaxis protein
MDSVFSFIQTHKLYFDLAHALSGVLNVFAWCLAGVLLAWQWRRIRRVSLGPFSFWMAQKQEAVDAAVTAARAWKTPGPQQAVDVPRIQATVERAFAPEAHSALRGKSILWADDNPANNELAVRALRKFHLDVEQVTSTEAALAAIQRRHFHLVISDMGRGSDMRAGYGLLKLLREAGNEVPFFIFAGSDSAEFRREAAERGAQLSTNDMLELVDNVVAYLGKPR